MDGLQLTLFGHNDRGFIGFIHGTNELLYLEKPKNWKELVEQTGLPYISHEDVMLVNEEKIKEMAKTDKKSKKSKKKS